MEETSQRPDYGLDAPPVVYGYAALGIVGVVLIVVGALVFPALLGWGVWATVVGLVVAGPMVYSSKVGKARVRDRLLDGLTLRGTEDVLDLGCGSGLMLLGAVRRLTSGTATGVDLWRSRDQAGSNREQCLANARRLGVADRVTLVDGDMTELPFPDASFELVLGCLAVHNLHPAQRRKHAVAAATAGLHDVRRSGYLRGIFPPARTLTATLPTTSTQPWSPIPRW